MSDCPELDELFAELAEGSGPALTHAKSCAHCAELLEDHRQLEKDLFRLADPLPPADFVNQVMAKVAAAPTSLRTELIAGLSIFVATAVLAVLVLVLGDPQLGSVGVKLASQLVQLKAVAIAVMSAVFALWNAAAIPIAAGMTALVVASLMGLRRLTRVELIAAEGSTR
jgi:hypothetical protein